MNDTDPLALIRRPRRLRRTLGLRTMVAETAIAVADLIQPLFVIEGDGSAEPIESMPGQQRWPVHLLVEECRQLALLGVPAVALFPKLADSLKDAAGRDALNPETLILRAVRAVKAAVPDKPVSTVNDRAGSVMLARSKIILSPNEKETSSKRQPFSKVGAMPA